MKSQQEMWCRIVMASGSMQWLSQHSLCTSHARMQLTAVIPILLLSFFFCSIHILPFLLSSACAARTHSVIWCSSNRIKVFLIGKHVNDAKINIWRAFTNGLIYQLDFTVYVCVRAHEWLLEWKTKKKKTTTVKIVSSHKISFYGIHKWKYE